MIPISIYDIEKVVKGDIISRELFLEDIKELKVNSVSTDTRVLGKNSLFIPIIGENFDGHNFINQAFEKGALVCLSEKTIENIGDKLIIKVKDTKEALRNLATYYRSLFDIPVIAVTGSVGKTSCKDMIAAVLKQKYKLLKTEGNFNNEIGLPLTIFRLEKEHQVMVLEMGMNHFGEIYRLSKIARPNYAVITNIGVSHIENLGNKEGILKAKCEIFSFMNEYDIGVINGDDEYLINIKNEIPCKMITYGLKDNNKYKAYNILSKGFKGINANIKTPQEEYKIHINMVGEHMIYNALPAIVIGEKLGLTVSEIQNGIESFFPTKMRLNIYKINKEITIIDDVYNASPDSMKAALNTLKSLDVNGRKVAILGDMFEMGDYSETAHKDVGKYVATKNIDLLICVGKATKYIKQSALCNGMKKNTIIYYENLSELLSCIKDLINEKDIVLVKASRGMHLERIVQKIKEVMK